jgi:hypothetical protein
VFGVDPAVNRDPVRRHGPFSIEGGLGARAASPWPKVPCLNIHHLHLAVGEQPVVCLFHNGTGKK